MEEENSIGKHVPKWFKDNTPNNIRIKGVKAILGKHERMVAAQPPFKQGRVFFAEAPLGKGQGTDMDKLQRQLLLFNMDGLSSSKSPDRADAMCHALRYLMRHDKNRVPFIPFGVNKSRWESQEREYQDTGEYLNC